MDRKVLAVEARVIEPTRRWAMIVGLTLAMGWPLVLAALIPYQNLANLRQDSIVLAAEWISVLVIFAIVVSWERRPFFATVGWVAPKARDWRIIAFFALIAAVISLVLAKQHPTMSVRGTIFAQVYGIPFALRVALVFTAGICEETLFRGYAIERLKLVTGNIWLGGLMAAALFTLGHIPRYGLTTGLLGVAGIAVMLTFLYIWRRNIWPCIVLHWLIDGIPLLVVPAFATFK